MNELNKKTVLTFIDGMSNGDSAAVDRCLAPNAVAVTKGHSQFTGTVERGTIVTMVGAMKTFLPTGLGARILRVIAEDETVMVEFEGNGLTSQGLPYRNQYCMVFDMVGGKISRSHEYFCTRHAEEVLWPLVAGAGIVDKANGQ